ncbi:alginate O-acetyltransferase AlgX-related protein [Owenweeksia hongkongensis]|uniref:alginate O-acetyltransferase AlgX-related protein n=1 Tax=Owenweeksia hongkongensis TaxID=253245 RepID=UPI003A9391BA
MEKKLVILGFIAILTIPFILFIFGIRPEFENTENRRLTPKPQFGWTSKESKGTLQNAQNLSAELGKYFEDFDAYYNDHFAFKPIFFTTYYQLQTKVFHTNPIPQKVVKGDEGWYFLGNLYSDVISESKGISNFSQKELNRIKENIENNARWLKQYNIEYYVAVAPNKHTIYGQFLPIAQGNLQTKLSQVKDMLSKTKINFVDLSENLKDHLNQKLYDKTGSHWNDLGGYYGYTALMDKISTQFPTVEPIDPKDFTIVDDTVNQEDLTRMLAIETIEHQPFLKMNKSCAIQIDNKLPIPAKHKGPAEKYEHRYFCPDKSFKVLVFRDSFAKALIQPIAETFGKSLFIRFHDLDKDLILEEKPDLVIYEIVERDIDVLLRQ